MYEYSKMVYQYAIERKNDIRKRVFTIFNLGYTVVSAIMTTSFITKPDNFSCSKKILLIFVFLCFLKSAFLFFQIYLPSKVQHHSPTNINADLRNEHYLRGKDDEPDNIKETLSFDFVANVLAENINYINERNDKFRKLFIIMTLLIISSIFLALTTLLI